MQWPVTSQSHGTWQFSKTEHFLLPIKFHARAPHTNYVLAAKIIIITKNLTDQYTDLIHEEWNMLVHYVHNPHNVFFN
jgi:hypothetical protein